MNSFSKILLTCALVLAPTISHAAKISEMTTDELYAALAGAPRCTLETSDAEGYADLGLKVDFIETNSDDGDPIFFAEVESQEKKYLIYLEKTSLRFIGWGFTSKKTKAEASGFYASGSFSMIENYYNRRITTADVAIELYKTGISNLLGSTQRLTGKCEMTQK